ncbi:PIN domain-containing protein [Fibrella sp. HMF5335]|uniref:PIN domain-containing protein n=1 Tax=Fibrella rubiginis TaxID=2817060 RepID=A0A939GMU0_9BACT|nr:PIN domain-containing protein [Fibrella rubiginis]MBO0939705.1 PIN domain-containing protein [Fibrella rubiginis]
MADHKSALLLDTGLLSRYFLGQPMFSEAYDEAMQQHSPVISTAVFIELQHWLVLQRGLKEPISRSEYDRHRHRLDKAIVLNNDGVSYEAMQIARRWPDTGVGDCYTIATALVFDVPIFTLNPKHFERVTGVTLYKTENYPLLLDNVRRY